MTLRFSFYTIVTTALINLGFPAQTTVTKTADSHMRERGNPRNHNVITLGLHLGYSWSPGSTLKEIGTRSALRLAQKASQTARCTALYTTSKPVRVTKAIGRQHSSTGKSHCVGLMVKRHETAETQRSTHS